MFIVLFIVFLNSGNFVWLITRPEVRRKGKMIEKHLCFKRSVT